VEFVEDHQHDAFERGVVLQPARENALGHDFDARALADPGFQARAKADGLADGLAQHLRHARRDGAGGDATRLEHHDLAGRQRLCGQQGQRHAG
jgi:hypothetical protein